MLWRRSSLRALSEWRPVAAPITSAACSLLTATEAATRPTMRFVELKSQDQQDMQTLHRSRDRLVGERTALINQLRAILLERGMIAPNPGIVASR